MIPGLDIPSICQAKDCKEPVQIVSKIGDTKTYMKTCRRHNYTDLPAEKERSKSNK